MKAIVNAQTLAKELKKVAPIIKKTTVLPILTCVNLRFENNKLTIEATDLETTVLSTIDCECKNPFTVVVDFESLADICSRIAEPITIDTTGDHISIASSNSKFKFAKTKDQEHFPRVPDDEFIFSIDVDVDFFIALANANVCKSNDQYKPNMNTACVHIKKDSLTVVGIDGYFAYKKDLKIKTGKETQLLVSEQFVQMTKQFGDAKISVSEKFIKAEYAGTIIISRMQDSKFCSYEVIIPKEIEYNLKIDRSSLISSLGIAGVSAHPATHLCSINFNGGDIKIASSDIDFGKEGETRCAATHTVEIKSIGVNANQLQKLLNLFDSQEVEMAFRGENATIFLRPFGEPNTLCLLQPIALL